MLYMFEKKCEQKDILIIDELSEIQVNVENDGLRTITDLDSFTIQDIHNINEESLLVFSNIHSWNELFLIKSIPNQTQFIGSIYKEEYLKKIKDMMNEPIFIIKLEQVDGVKRIKKISTSNKN